MSLLAFSLAGSLLAFLFFNFSPASIFMGDSGSTTIGLMLAVLAIKTIETSKADVSDGFIGEIHRPVFVMAVLAYPLIDTLRIFIYRTIKGASPFEADRNHIHHALIDAGFNHRKASLLLYTANLLVIALSILLRNMQPTAMFLLTFAFTLALAQIPFFIKLKQIKKAQQNAGIKSTKNGSEIVNPEAKKKLFEEKDY
jgi:UDP-N-acetylmuramyl pentapeptide phosphotransferase/UDP-N-acetylglucosamine-1-phosphate transferase